MYISERWVTYCLGVSITYVFGNTKKRAQLTTSYEPKTFFFIKDILFFPAI